MGWNNPDVSWRELERQLSGRVDPGDVPISSRRPEYEAPPVQPVAGPSVPYAELHCHSSYSFLDGATGPEGLIEEAVRLGLTGLAITDHDGFAGAPLFAEAAADHAGEGHRLLTVYGAELSLGLTRPQNGVADPEGAHLLVLARGVEGYHQLAAAMTDAHLRGDEKGHPAYDLDELGERGRGNWIVLTGCRKGTVRQALAHGGRSAAAAALDDLTARFGLDAVFVELTDHGHPQDTSINDALAALAADHGLPVVATNNVHHARPADHRLAAAMAAVRARRSLTEIDGWLPATGAAHLRSGAEMQARFARYPGAVTRSVQIAGAAAFDLRAATPRLPRRGIPEGHTAMSWLRVLADRGIDQRYGHNREAARERIAAELDVIEEKDFPGYFLIVNDIVAWARSQQILCQGRGSSANSALCYALGITAVDSIRYDLPFARFLATTREEEPDIDVDFDSARREEVIQWVYDTYGRHNAAQVANVITYRPRSAIRDAAKALGYSVGQQDAWSKQIDGWNGIPEDSDAPPPVRSLADQFLGLPRHLGIHSGGMILTERPIGEVVPIERGRMDKRTVLQWDKDACEYMGLVKFDLLGLGMLGAIGHAMQIVAEHTGEQWELRTIPGDEPAVYDMLCRADSIGVFQVESRAQIGTLPRLQPREYYDLAIEIALIRPGPIQGGAVHPYIRRATGREPITYPHPVLEPVLRRTKGVPLFQEQLMQMAIAIGDCSGDDADLLRRAMGSKRGTERIEKLRAQLYAGMKRHGLSVQESDAIYLKIQSFANFGFAESHALSFALLVYASSWLKLHYPGAFLAALLRNQPMGFYSPQSLVTDARRHGVRVLRPDVMHSQAEADLELLPGQEPGSTGRDACLSFNQPHPGKFVPGTPDPTPEHRRDGRYAVRLGLDEVQGMGLAAAQRVVAARAERPFVDMADVSRRADLTAVQMESLATAGAFDAFGLSRRQALWNAGYVERTDQLEGTGVQAPPPMLPGMSDVEITMADLWATHISPETHPVEHLRPLLTAEDICSVESLGRIEHGTRVRVGGLITHRQRPGTASGVTFLNLEDETGMLNVVCSQSLWAKYRVVARTSAGLVIRGRLERNDGVINLIADKLERIEIVYPHRSRDFQ